MNDKQLGTVLAVLLASAGCTKFDSAADGGADAGAQLDGAVADAIADAGFVGESRCYDDLAGTLFCDGFEYPNLEGWFASRNNGTLDPTQTPVYRGLTSLRASMTAIEGTASAERTITPRTSGTVYARGYFNIPSATFTYLQVLKLIEPAAPFGGLNVAVTGGAIPRLDVLGMTAQAIAPLPLDQWICLEVEVSIGASGSAELRVDGAVVATLSGINTAPAGGYSVLGVGTVFADAAQPMTDVFVDEVLVHDGRIGCDP